MTILKAIPFIIIQIFVRQIEKLHQLWKNYLLSTRLPILKVNAVQVTQLKDGVAVCCMITYAIANETLL
ncbi:hypothetical protein SUGI_0354360 [Cryptomeria japonica]|nr:hypothetical protein SUGI_0354360 [Cryptomeria japonica]